MRPDNVVMWRCVADKMSYALSVRDYNEMTHEVTIKHYRIRKLDRGGVYISPKKSFSDLLQLVEHYSSKCIAYLICWTEGMILNWFIGVKRMFS